MDKRAIARITVGTGRGTGFLISNDRLVLTALHVVADLERSVRNGRLRELGDPILLEFGDPLDHNTWRPDGPAEIVRELYNLRDDWAVLRFRGAIPDGVVPFRLADLGPDPTGVPWKTFGFPDVAATVGSDFDGLITSGGPEAARLHSDAATGVRMRGISGAPCVVDGDAVALIGKAILDNELCQGGALVAIRIRKIAEAADGRLPFSQPVPVPFEREVRTLLSTTDAAALRDAANVLGIPERPSVADIARTAILAGIEPAARVLGVLAVGGERRNEVIDMVAAAQLHHEAVERLAEAQSTLKPGVVRASAEETCTWYTQRACDLLKLQAAGWGNRLLHVNVAGHEETAPAAAAGADPIEVAADGVLALIRARAEQQWTRPRFRNSALAGDLRTPICVALHDEHRVQVVYVLRHRLPNAHFLMVNRDELELTEAERAQVATIAPHVEDEDGLLLAYDTARTTTDRPAGG